MEWLRKEATLNNLNTMIDFILNNLKKDVMVTEHIDMEIRLLCEEVLMNIISYAYEEDDDTGEMLIGYEYDENNKWYEGAPTDDEYTKKCIEIIENALE